MSLSFQTEGTTTDSLFKKYGLDPITFEILRHRLWAINDESATALRLVSGSPVANEAYDMNTALMNVAGDDFVIGTFIAIHALSMNIMAKYILEEYSENPGINPGDSFLCNDPYVGCQHQMDAIVLSPIHYKGELVAWTGSTVHNIDLGGPNEGQVQLDAQSIFGEQPILPPIKIVERGNLRKDLERAWTRRSRLPDLVALDLRALLAANNVARNRMIELIDEYGLETIKKMMDAILDYTEVRFRGRLQELPDGVWRHRSYMDYKNDLYRIVLTMTKKGDQLLLDFRGTDKQAPAVINCTWAGLRSAFMSAILAYLCFDMPWCPAGVIRTIKVLSEPGTVIHSEYPAGVCKATTAASWAATNVTAACLGKMLAASDQWKDHTMSLWQGTQSIEDLFGYDQRGKYFGATILDCMAGGTGARSFADGINTGGFIVSMSGAISNVEASEFRYPILYLYRKQMPDTGGPGKFRGGVGASMMYIAHDVDNIPTKIMHTYGVEVPDTIGIGGGYPSSTNLFSIRRETNIRELLNSGQIPSDLEDLDGEWEQIPAITKSYLGSSDVYRVVAMGGGGYGDPILRDPQRVRNDIENQLVSIKFAKKIYGVVVDPDDFTVDEGATKEARREARSRRLQLSEGKRSFVDASGAERIAPFNEVMEVVSWKGDRYIRCQCKHIISPVMENYKLHALQYEAPLNEAGPWVNPDNLGDGRLVLRQFYCPNCQVVLENEVTRKDDPVLWDTQLLFG